jgi:hypothetical protein
MGFFDDIFGSSEQENPRAPTLDPRALRAQNLLISKLGPALGGGGLTPSIDARTRVERRKALNKEFVSQKRELPGQLNRLVPREDVKVRRFARESLSRGFAREKEAIDRSFEARGFEDRLKAQDIALGTLGLNERIATQNASTFIGSKVRRSFAPDFRSELIRGIAGPAGSLVEDPRFRGDIKSGATDFFNLFSNLFKRGG